MCKSKKSYINILYVISTIAVVLLHTNGFFFANIHASLIKYIFANIIECICYFAVPIFFMLSGANLINYRERYSTLTLYKKRIFKVFIPFMFWMFISILCCIFIYKTISTDSLNIKYILNGIINNQFNISFWFFIPLFVLYLNLPLLNYLIKSKKLFSFSIFILLILLQCPFSVLVLTCLTAITYALIGYILDNVKLSKKIIYIIYIAAIFGLLSHFIKNLLLSPSFYSFGYKNLDCILYSIGIFTFIKNYANKLYSNNIFKTTIEFLKEYSFAIYLLHENVIKIITIIFNLNFLSLYYKYIVPFEVVFTCILITYIIRKIPFGKYILTK